LDESWVVVYFLLSTKVYVLAKWWYANAVLCCAYRYIFYMIAFLDDYLV